MGPIKPQRSRGARSTERSAKLATAQGGDRTFNFTSKRANNSSFENQQAFNNTPTQFLPVTHNMQNFYTASNGASQSQEYNYNINFNGGQPGGQPGGYLF